MKHASLVSKPKRSTIAVLTLLLLVIGLVSTNSPSARAGGPGDSGTKTAATTAQVLCSLIVPPNPLTAVGLATPWQLQAPCHEADPASAVFVQGVIFNPTTKALSTYSPLVIDQGTVPAVLPTPPILPTNAVVGLWGGSNGDVTSLIDPNKYCTNGADGKKFGQVFFCNAHSFFTTVLASGIVPPTLGTALDGQPCPTVRSFRIVDQDQSDNVQTTYLATASGQTMQNTAANRALFPTASVMKNPSDNRVLSDFIDPALGCKSWAIPDLADNGALEPTQVTNELQARAYQHLQAFIPAGDPMVGPNDLLMVNAYRVRVGQPSVSSLSGADTELYCDNIQSLQPGFLALNQARFSAWPSPIPTYPNLYAFMEGRLAATYTNLGCTSV